MGLNLDFHELLLDQSTKRTPLKESVSETAAIRPRLNFSTQDEINR